ncbi:hypothetical protein GCM10010207_75480 [Streptomyces atratus]|nr:hypothetical protein GCM10010207_75480 [Streptomyces atratus]
MFRVPAADVRQDVGAHLAELLGEAEVHVERGMQGDPEVAMGQLVQVEEALAPGVGVLDAAEPIGKAMTIFERFAATLRVGIVV